MMRFLLLLISISNTVNAELWIIPRSERIEKIRQKEDEVHSARSAPARTSPAKKDLATIEMEEFIERASKNPAIWDFTLEYDFKTGTVLKGRILNSIVSTNLESPLIVEIFLDQGLPEGTIFSCTGTTKHKRVVAACNRMITPGHGGDEFSVVTSLLNTDGSAGIKADYFYSGKEELVAGAIAFSFARGVIENSQDRIATPLGQTTPDTIKNNYLNGVLGATDELTNMMRQEMQTREPKVFIKAGKPILIYFNQRFKI